MSGRYSLTEQNNTEGERRIKGDREGQVHLLADYSSPLGVNNSWHLFTLLMPTPVFPAVSTHNLSPAAFNLPRGPPTFTMNYLTQQHNAGNDKHISYQKSKIQHFELNHYISKITVLYVL